MQWQWAQRRPASTHVKWSLRTAHHHPPRPHRTGANPPCTPVVPPVAQKSQRPRQVQQQLRSHDGAGQLAPVQQRCNTSSQAWHGCRQDGQSRAGKLQVKQHPGSTRVPSTDLKHTATTCAPTRDGAAAHKACHPGRRRKERGHQQQGCDPGHGGWHVPVLQNLRSTEGEGAASAVAALWGPALERAPSCRGMLIRTGGGCGPLLSFPPSREHSAARGCAVSESSCPAQAHTTAGGAAGRK